MKPHLWLLTATACASFSIPAWAASPHSDESIHAEAPDALEGTAPRSDRASSTPVERPSQEQAPEGTPVMASSDEGDALALAGYIAGVSGVAIAGLGAAIGLHGLLRTEAAVEPYGRYTRLGAGERALADAELAAGRAEATAGWVTAGLGGGAIVAGIVMLAVAPPDRDHETVQASAVPWASPDGGGLTVVGRW